MSKFSNAADTHRDPKSDRSNRGNEANYVNRSRNHYNVMLHVGEDGFVDGWIDKKGKFHEGEYYIGGILNRRPISHYIQYDFELGLPRPNVMEGFNIGIRYCAEYWAKLQAAARFESDEFDA